MGDVALDAINVIAELDRMGWGWEPGGDDELKVKCPAHADETPSCSLNIEKRMFRCHTAGCGVHGDFITFMALALKSTRRVIIEELSTRYDIETTRTVDGEAVERFHQRVWDSGPLLQELYKRAVNDDDIRKYRIGFDGKRLTIPIRNESGLWVNVRRYLPGAPGSEKMRNLRGHGELRLFPLDQLKYDVIVVCGGELKAIVTARMLNPHGIGAISATGGEGNWEREFSTKLRSKRIYICFDIDPEGRDAANTVAARNSAEAGWVGVAELPLDPDKYPHGDLNDYWAEGRTAQELLDLLDKVPPWEPASLEKPEPEGDAQLIHLAFATEPQRSGKKVRVRAVVTAKDQDPYHVPREVSCRCDRNQPFCTMCPVFVREPENKVNRVTMEVPSDSPSILAMIEAPKKGLRDAIREGLRIPVCKSVVFQPTSFYSVEDLRLTPQLELSSTGMDNIQRNAYYVGHGLEDNASYEFTGRVHPAPRDQRATLLASQATPTEDTLQSFAPSDDELQQLHVFRPTEWTVHGVQAKLDELYADFEANVTRIWSRRDLHLVIDLVYHSALVFDFDGRQIKGWAEAIIVGDSGQGKTETSEKLMEHYGMGTRFVCKRVSASGLMGGLQQAGSRWFVTWGVMPTNDRRLVLLEELKGAPPEVLSKLTDMRSSGVAEVGMIEKRRTHARTRLIGITNPRDDKLVKQHSFGVEAIKNVMGSLEDIRRFDLGFVVSGDDVDPKIINTAFNSRKEIEHRHTPELCKRLVLWSWTRTGKQVMFTEEASAAIMTGAVYLCDKYTDALPLVDRGGMRHKLARLSVALAARTFSCGNEDPRKLVVRPCHVDYLIKFIDEHYSSKTCGYADYSRAQRATERLLETDTLKKRIMEAPFLVDFIESILHTTSIEMRDLMDWTGWDFDQGREMLSFLVRKHALVRSGNSYAKTAQFIELLKAMRDDPKVKENDRPDFLKDERSF